MRYLYADSEPFPLEYDFLATLRGFLECGATCLGAVAEIERQELNIEAAQGKHERHHLALDRYAKDARSGLDAALTANPLSEAVQGSAVQIEEALARTVTGAKQAADDQLRQVEVAAESRIGGQQEMIKTALGRFLLKERLEVEDTVFELVLENAGYAVSAACAMPEGLAVTYALDARRDPEWQRPKKVTEFAGELEVQVGMKKKFLGKSLVPEKYKIGDWSVVAATLGAERATLTLRKKPDSEKDTMVISLRRGDDGVRGEIRRSVELGAERESLYPAAEEDMSAFEGLWDRLDEECRSLLVHRDTVERIVLDGAPIQEAGRVATLIERYVAMYQPIVAEIAKRSPSAKELSLKVEHSDGKREELYLRREDLADVVTPLGDKEMMFFAPLDFFPEIDIEMD